MNKPDLSTSSDDFGYDVPITFVGWLDKEHEFTHGETPIELA